MFSLVFPGGCDDIAHSNNIKCILLEKRAYDYQTLIWVFIYFIYRVHLCKHSYPVIQDAYIRESILDL